MKKILASLAALSMLAPVAAQAREHPDNHGKHVSAKAHHKWAKGQKFDRRYATNYRVLNYRDYRTLRAPPRGYRWVRSGNDAVLIGITSGIISAVVTNAIR